jgi:hypothetical protein
MLKKSHWKFHIQLRQHMISAILYMMNTILCFCISLILPVLAWSIFNYWVGLLMIIIEFLIWIQYLICFKNTLIVEKRKFIKVTPMLYRWIDIKHRNEGV